MTNKKLFIINFKRPNKTSLFTIGQTYNKTMNAIFFVMTTVSIALLIYNNPELVLSSMIDGASNSVTLAVKLFAIYAIWLSIIEIMQKTGLNDKLSKAFDPIINKVFRGESSEAKQYISLNLSANFLGIGSVATPLGMKAVNAMDKKDGFCSDNIIMFIIINCTSIQLIPTTIISLRTQFGSNSPSDIIIPSLIASIVSSIVGIVLCIILSRITQKLRARRTK